jgi:cell division protein FtsB
MEDPKNESLTPEEEVPSPEDAPSEGELEEQKPLPQTEEVGLEETLEEKNLEEEAESEETIPPEEPVEEPETPLLTAEPEAAIPIEEVDEISAAEESRVRRFLRNALRLTLGLLIAFGLGFLTAFYTIYQSATAEIELGQSRLDQSQADLDTANQQITTLGNQISDLESQIEALSSLETEIQDLQTELDAHALHIKILRAQLDISTAILALSKDNRAQARLALNGTTETLKDIENMLEPDQREAVTPMQQRLELVLSEMEGDPYAAQSDLDVLAASILKLENSLFGNP